MIIGIDMGGTNIDGALIHDGALLKTVKHQTDRTDSARCVWRCLSELLEGVDKRLISRVHLSTTVCTNAIVEGTTAETAVVLQAGPGMRWLFDRMGDHVHHVSGSVDHRGILVAEEDREELRHVRDTLRQHPVGAMAVVGKFSTRNPGFERRARDFFVEVCPHITMGHSLSGKLNFPRRVQTAYLNAAVSATFAAFAGSVKQALAQEGIAMPVHVLKADGGTVSLDGALEKPVETILSGPAASFMGMIALCPQDQSDRVLLDIGGTTTDIFFLMGGDAVFEPEGIEIDGRKTLVRAVFSQSIGVGGDSHVRFENNALKIGPRRLGSAIAFGGQHLTPTDALVYLGAMKGRKVEESRMALENMAGERGMAPYRLAEDIVVQACGIIRDAVKAILKKLNNSPVYTIRELLADRAIRPRAVSLIGGPARAFAPYIERTLGLPVAYPEGFEVANAIGAALARPTLEVSLHADTARGLLMVPEMEVYEKIGRDFDLSKAKAQALNLAMQAGQTLGFSPDQAEVEIVEASSFNMIDGFHSAGKNIRVRAQIKPGLLRRLV